MRFRRRNVELEANVVSEERRSSFAARWSPCISSLWCWPLLWWHRPFSFHRSPVLRQVRVSRPNFRGLHRMGCARKGRRQRPCSMLLPLRPPGRPGVPFSLATTTHRGTARVSNRPRSSSDPTVPPAACLVVDLTSPIRHSFLYHRGRLGLCHAYIRVMQPTTVARGALSLQSVRRSMSGSQGKLRRPTWQPWQQTASSKRRR